jgi:hypothetical protein
MPTSRAQKAEPPERRKASVRFTERQWQQLRAHMFKHEITFQALVIDAIADKVEKFDR